MKDQDIRLLVGARGALQEAGYHDEAEAITAVLIEETDREDPLCSICNAVIRDGDADVEPVCGACADARFDIECSMTDSPSLQDTHPAWPHMASGYSEGL